MQATRPEERQKGLVRKGEGRGRDALLCPPSEAYLLGQEFEGSALSILASSASCHTHLEIKAQRGSSSSAVSSLLWCSCCVSLARGCTGGLWGGH